MGRPIITKWGDYSTFDIPTVAEYLSEQLWAKLERQGGSKTTKKNEAMSFMDGL